MVFNIMISYSWRISTESNINIFVNVTWWEQHSSSPPVAPSFESKENDMYHRTGAWCVSSSSERQTSRKRKRPHNQCGVSPLRFLKISTRAWHATLVVPQNLDPGSTELPGLLLVESWLFLANISSTHSSFFFLPLLVLYYHDGRTMSKVQYECLVEYWEKELSCCFVW